VRVSTAFNRLLQIPGAWVTDVVIGERDVEVTLRPKARRLHACVPNMSKRESSLARAECHPPAHLDVTGQVTLDDAAGARTITVSAPTVSSRVDGLDAAAFQKPPTAQGAACPVSRALASVYITVQATIV
jgi:hypothetical protein